MLTTNSRTERPDESDAASSSGGIRLVLAEDQRLVAEGIAMMLSFEDDLEVVDLVHSAERLLASVEAQQPEVVLVDVRLAGMDGLAVVREMQVRQLPTRAMVLTTFTDEATVARAVSAGVAGYLPKTIGREELVRAVRAVASDEGFLHPEVTRGFLKGLRAGDARARAPALSGREQQVLEALADGMSTKRIAESLDLREGTVKSHLTRLYMKLGVNDRVQAVVVAIRQGLVQWSPPVS